MTNPTIEFKATGVLTAQDRSDINKTIRQTNVNTVVLADITEVITVTSGVAMIADIQNPLSTGISAWQVVNDLGRRGSFGLAGSENALVDPNSLAIYQQGHGPTHIIVDGNEDIIFSTDVTDTHLLAYTEKMRLRRSGVLNLSIIATYADNAAAITGGLATGDIYRTSTGTLMIVYAT